MNDARRLVGDAVREARRARGLTQDALALAVGTPQHHICAIEAGRVNVQVDTLARIATALGHPITIPPLHTPGCMGAPRLAA